MITHIPAAGLSGREREILRHVARGKKNAEIAEDLGISIQTVKNHLSNIFDKLELDKGSRKRAVRIALGPTHLPRTNAAPRRGMVGGAVFAHA